MERYQFLWLRSLWDFESIWINLARVGEQERILGDASSFFVAEKTFAAGRLTAGIELLMAVVVFLFHHASADLACAQFVAAVVILAAHLLVFLTIWSNLGEGGANEANDRDLEFHTK